MGLFFGSAIATFIATINYFESKSRIGFVILVLMFCTVLFFITRMEKKLIRK